jgi:photoactive yellow protein
MNPETTPAAAGSDEGSIAELRRELALLGEENEWLRRDNESLRRELSRRRAGSSPPPASSQPPPPSLFSLARSDPERSPEAPPASFAPPPLPAPLATAPQQGLDFGAIAQLTPDKLDGLPYGLITLDARGRVLHYNDTESRLVGLPKERVLGRNFFQDVAPCTRIREFEGRFRELAANPVEVRVQSFDFIFKFARGEQRVSVVMTPGRVRGQFHLALLRRVSGGAGQS